jgi:hypothetical protein
VRRLFDTSVGRLEVEIDGTKGVVSAYRFDANGQVVAETGDEWDNADVANLLTVEAGVPAQEAREIEATLLREWRDAGGSPPFGPTGRLGAVVGVSVVAGVLGSALVGIWTIIRALLRL